MSTPSRTSLNASIVVTPLRAELWLSREELAAGAGISPAKLARLVRLGLVEPVAPEPREFTAATLARLRRILRLHDDLEVDLVGAAIIEDLLERLERMETELTRLRGGS
jgi:DNA-binding transcriptional MerR regulator